MSVLRANDGSSRIFYLLLKVIKIVRYAMYACPLSLKSELAKKILCALVTIFFIM